ncbi:FliA/WhiG family RNA polymerase sigma factor [Bacillus sp. FJAT-49736]|uniref:FliA/WhiG family RNA polymerase sigma factor n=1 Tax=Bacillus sp. FJAT-49736 TaxID=2833582 RepID=UPI001BC9E89B|nr:FliA/WhiG family RNA polymerase sigma factor [Bacillus sp. FJAT-49736]MBS4172542.1 FliA/WhiG family RNA polymerase sigma factor [Bacillus sp. FJAT-49736]
MSKTETIEEQKYWELWIGSRNTQAGDVLVKKYMPLVHYHVQRIAVGLPRNVSRDDLKSFGMLGLLDALNKFDAKRDLKFDTYASFRIRGAILDGLRKEDWLPRSTREKAKKIEATLERLEQRYMRHVTPEEIAQELNISEEDVYQTMNEQFFANVLSVDEHTHDKEDNDSHSFAIKDEQIPSPEDYLIHEEKIQDMTKVISTLSEKEQLVLSLFYHEELTLTEIGEVMSLSTSRISQIHSKALYKLKNILEKKM